MKAALHNLGCKVNAYETDAMGRLLEEAGYELVPFPEYADVYVINTCTVTNIADRKSRQMIRRARTQNPDAVIVACGCHVQIHEEDLKKAGLCDILIGNDEKQKLPELLTEFRKSRSPLSAVCDLSRSGRSFVETPALSSGDHTRAFLKIQDGCDEFCSYCLIPFARGRIRSRHTEEILKETRIMLGKGIREFVLSGIHVSAFGRDTGESLLALIRQMDAFRETGLYRIRLSSLEPRVLTGEFLKGIKDLPSFCPHFHLSLQSGCDTVLKRMNRKYTCAEYEELCRMISETFTHPAMTTDVITGFPGESEEEFEATYAFLKDLPFSKIHVFPFSARKGTKAASMSDQVTPETKKRRSDLLLALTAEKEKEFARWYIGRETEVLFEEKIKTPKGVFWTGYNKEYVRFYLPDGRRNERRVFIPTEDNLL